MASKQKQFVLSKSLRNSSLDNQKSFDLFFIPQITLMCCGFFWGWNACGSVGADGHGRDVLPVYQHPSLSVVTNTGNNEVTFGIGLLKHIFDFSF